jgi:predicted NUDIX family NTP pyrophosphohydrolase
MAQRSAGLLFYRRVGEVVEVLLVHPGGPFWRRKQVGAWQIPKGMIEPGEEPAATARREAEEELGVAVTAPLVPLGEVQQSGGNMVEAFAAEQDIDADAIVSNLFEIEWPPGSGSRVQFPEVDAARWFAPADAAAMILPSQAPLLDRLRALLG